MSRLPMVTFPVLLLTSKLGFADGNTIDKIYHPYVDALEQEIEFRSVFQDKTGGLDNPRRLDQLSFGRSFGERWFAEVYLIGEKPRSGGYKLEAVELELKRQLTEQGEFWADWGMLFELEKEIQDDVQEVSVGLFIEKEFGRFSGTANLFLIQEWGSDINDELETAISLQARYRYSRFFEPALEYYQGQDNAGLGPVILGTANFGAGQSLHWEAGVIFGTDSKSADNTFRFLLEYEF